MSQRIAWIGTGVMGASLAAHVLDADHRLVIHSRTKSRAQPLLDRGASWADTPAAAAEGADVAISMVGFPQDVEQVHLGSTGTLASSHPPAVIIDMTTSRPSLARRVAEVARDRNVASLDAPVSGGDVGARNASLSIMVGGDSRTLEHVRPLLALMGKTIVHHGPPGSGQHAKMVNQILIASAMVGVCEGLLYAKAAGLDANNVLESVGSGAAGSWTVANLAPRIIRGDFAPGFFVEHFVKDLGIALEEAVGMGVDLPGLALAKRLYDQVMSMGHGRKGTQALFLAMASTG